MAMCDERAHALRLCNCQRLSVVAHPASGVESVRMARDVAEQAQRVSRGARLASRGLDGAITKFPRLVNPAEQQGSVTCRTVGPSAMTNDPPFRLTLEELLAVPNSVQRLAGLATLR